MPDAFYIVIVCVAAIGIDWALYNGSYRGLRAFYRVPDGINYRYFLFPRLFLIVAAGVVVSIATLSDRPNVSMAMTGFAIFLAASIYAQIATFMKAERYRDDHDA